MKIQSLWSDPEKEIDYINRIVYESLDVVSGCIVSSDLDELTASPSRLGATIREAGVRLLGVCERRLENLINYVSPGSPSRQHSNSTLYDIQMFGANTPSKTTCPVRYNTQCRL